MKNRKKLENILLKNTHKDYKSKTGILMLVNGGTTLMPLTKIQDDKLIEMTKRYI